MSIYQAKLFLKALLRMIPREIRFALMVLDSLIAAMLDICAELESMAQVWDRQRA